MTSRSIFKGKLRDKFPLRNNLINHLLFLHTASLKSRCFLFILIILAFILDFRLVRELVFFLYILEALKSYHTIPYHRLPEVTVGDRKLEGVTRGYRGLQGVRSVTLGQNGYRGF